MHRFWALLALAFAVVALCVAASTVHRPLLLWGSIGGYALCSALALRWWREP